MTTLKTFQDIDAEELPQGGLTLHAHDENSNTPPPSSSGHPVLVADIRALMAATATAADTKLTEVRQRLHSALDEGGKILVGVEQQAAQGIRYADQTVRARPYQSTAAGLIFGVLSGRLASRP